MLSKRNPALPHLEGTLPSSENASFDLDPMAFRLTDALPHQAGALPRSGDALYRFNDMVLRFNPVTSGHETPPLGGTPHRPPSTTPRTAAIVWC
jgi:hypothetical protein